MEFLHSQLDLIEEQLSWVKTEPIDWKLYGQAFSWSICLFESYLLLRQYPFYSKKAPPAEIAAHIDDSTFEKSQNYGRDKARYAFVSGLLRQALDSVLLHYGVYAWAWISAGDIIRKLGYGPDYEILQSNVFAGILFLQSVIVSVPFSVYQTFVLEEKHGFNKTSPRLFVSDLYKGWLLAIGIGAPFLSAFLYVFKWAGDRFLPWLMGFLITFQITMVFIYPTVIQPLFNKLSPLKEGELRSRIESLAGHLRFPLKHLYEIDGSKRSSHSNAYFYGLPWSKHIVIFDTLIKESAPDEVEAVLAHELGHWYFSHPTKLLCISQVHIFSILAAFPAFLHAPAVLRAFDFPPSIASKPPTIIAFLVYQIILSPMESAIGAAMNALSRKFEWQADQFACELPDRLNAKDMSDMGPRLGRALTTLHVKNLSTVWVDWLYSAYHHSHPTLTERLRAISAFEDAKAGRADRASKKEQ